MKENQLVSPGSFCWKRDCPDYGRVNHGNLVKYGRTAKGTPRLKCKTCGHVSVVNRGTIFCGRHHSPDTIMDCLALLAERNSLASIHRTKGIKEETVIDWLREAANHAQEVEKIMQAKYNLVRVQLDAMWSYVGHKGEKGGVLKRPIEVLSGEEQLLM
jgi:transposase-like protein